MIGVFAQWQPRYAARGVATFPVAIDVVNENKKPAVINYLKTGLKGSAQLVLRFPEAEALGFACGRYNRITVIDMDSTDPAIVEESERIFGRSPLVWMTGRGRYAMAFRHNGEPRDTESLRRSLRLPIDLLGGGFCVAPPSAGITRPYQFIRGSLDALDHLPIARIPTEIASPRPRKIEEGKRNVSLFAHCNSIVGYCDDVDALIDVATTWANDHFELALPAAEIKKTCHSVWKYRGGRVRLMGSQLMAEAPQFKALIDHSNADSAALLLLYLTAHNGPASTFMIADGLGAALGWPARRVPEGRKALLDVGIIQCVRRHGNRRPALYRWRQPT